MQGGKIKKGNRAILEKNPEFDPSRAEF